MKNKKLSKCLLTLVLAFTLCVFTFSPTASAILNKNGSITLNVFDSVTEKAIESVSFRLYFVASAHESDNDIAYKYIKPYDESNIDLSKFEDSYLPIHLTHFAFTRNLDFTIKVSDKNGRVVFDNLVPGVYLVVPMRDNPNYYVPSPFVVNIPLYNNENNSWIYDINATPKMQLCSTEYPQQTTYISVKKLWDTNEEHPDSVTVSLLCDFREVEKIELNEGNSWHYRWDNLSTMHSWSVVESDVPDGYTVSYEASSNTISITNKKTSTPEQYPTTEPTTKPEELVDTGQLNWPIPVFSIAGLILFSLGWAILNFDKKAEEAI